MDWDIKISESQIFRREEINAFSTFWRVLEDVEQGSQKCCYYHYEPIKFLIFFIFFPLRHCAVHYRMFSNISGFSWFDVSNTSQIRSVAQSCPTLCDPINCSMPGLPVHHQFPEFTETYILWVDDAIQPSHPLSSPSPPAPNPSQHQSLFQWVNSSHEVAKVLEFQL